MDHFNRFPFFFLFTWLCVTNALGATLPTSYNLEILTDEHSNPMDPKLAAWFREYVDAGQPLDLRSQEFEQFVSNVDLVPATFLRLRYAAIHAQKGANFGAAGLESARRAMDSQNIKQSREHPLYPYMLQELIEYSKTPRPDVKTAYQELDAFGERSCPRKDYVLREQSALSQRRPDEDLLKKQLLLIQTFKSPRFRKEALDSFLDMLPKDLQEKFRAELFPLVKDYSKLLNDNAWLLGDDDAAASKLGVSEPARSLRVIGSNATRQKCRTAKVDYLNLLAKYGQKENFELFAKTAEQLEDCFSRKGNSPRETYWRQLESPLEKAFGFRGAEIAKRRVALLRWGRDDFEYARKEFALILERAETDKMNDLIANSLFTLARIEENESQIDASIEYYKKFVTRFPDSEKFVDAELALVLLHHINGDGKAALANSQAIIEAQSKLSLDQRNTGAMSFALFWAGRESMELGDEKVAKEYWQRVASEYYSTFYGALGHFLLEKVEGKPFVLSPSRTASFDADRLFNKFSKADLPTVRRATSLLQFGLKEESSCEIAEIEVAPQDYDQLLAKSLLQHAAGEWLPAIKAFDSLPRSFRNSLAMGFERVLFPRAFDETVAEYAKRLGLDAELVFAIIRQESVFNPKANSPAGARGLMQLMPGTARVEVKRLDSNYIDQQVRKQLRRKVELNADGLFDADTNIAIGVHHVFRLLAKYNNPVFVLTSYNANPNATERWKQNLPTKDFLTFIERIPYAETRTYVKLVLRNYFYYKRWYKGANDDMPHLNAIAGNLLGTKG